MLILYSKMDTFYSKNGHLLLPQKYIVQDQFSKCLWKWIKRKPHKYSGKWEVFLFSFNCEPLVLWQIRFYFSWFWKQWNFFQFYYLNTIKTIRVGFIFFLFWFSIDSYYELRMFSKREFLIQLCYSLKVWGLK